MTITVVGSASTVAASGDNADLTLPVGTAADDVVFIVVASDGAATGGNNKPNTSDYVQLFYDTSSSPSAYFGYKIMGNTPDTVVNFSATTATSGSTASVIVFRGVDVNDPIAVAMDTASGTSGAPNPPSLVLTAGQMSVILGATEDAVVASVTAPTGWSDLEWRHDGTTNACQTTMLACQLIATDGTYDPAAFTTGQSNDWHAGHVALRAAATGTTWTPVTTPSTTWTKI